jgi:hypothetical protein
VPADVTTDFVDRKPELALFHRMLAGETAERILRILERGEQGKTFFLLRLFHECEQQRPPVPVVLLDFDQRRSGLTDYLSVSREVRRHLGDDCTPAICACEDYIYRRAPLMSIRTGEGDAGLDFGQRGRFTEADISDIRGRDSISVNVRDISGGVPPADVAKQRADMGRALCNDLAGLTASHRHVVLLIDTFEHALKSEDTCAWLERWLFEPLRHQLRHILLVVAGRPECQTFFAQPRLWSGLVARIDRFDPFSDDDIRDHYRQRGIPISEEEMPLLLDLARPSPAMMAQIGDTLEQARGGGGR